MSDYKVIITKLDRFRTTLRPFIVILGFILFNII